MITVVKQSESQYRSTSGFSLGLVSVDIFCPCAGSEILISSSKIADNVGTICAALLKDDGYLVYKCFSIVPEEYVSVLGTLSIHFESITPMVSGLEIARLLTGRLRTPDAIRVARFFVSGKSCFPSRTNLSWNRFTPVLQATGPTHGFFVILDSSPNQFKFLTSRHTQKRRLCGVYDRCDLNAQRDQSPEVALEVDLCERRPPRLREDPQAATPDLVQDARPGHLGQSGTADTG